MSEYWQCCNCFSLFPAENLKLVEYIDIEGNIQNAIVCISCKDELMERGFLMTADTEELIYDEQKR